MTNQVSVACGNNRIENILTAISPLEKELSEKLDNCESILIKPNLVSVDNPVANSNVGVVRTLIEFFQKLGVEQIIVGDGSGSAYYKGQSTDRVLSRFGYTTLPQDYDGVKVLNLDKLTDYMPVPVETIHGHDTIRVLRPPADFIISLAIPKTHDYALATLSLKNMMGLIAPEDRIKIHGVSCGADIGGGLIARVMPRKVQMFFYENTPDAILSLFKNKKNYQQCVSLIHRNLLNLFKTVMPDCSIIDGFSGMECNGPTCGREIAHGFALASLNPVSADALGAYLMGLKPEDIGYLHYCEKEGLGTLNWTTTGSCNIEQLRKNYTLHRDAAHQKNWK